MRTFTKEEMERLSGLEPHFNTAVNFGFKRNTTKAENDMIADIYEAAGGTGIRRNWACSHCVYAAYKLVGEWYFKTKTVFENQKPEEKPIEEPEEPKKVVVTKKPSKPATAENKPQRGRPKKQ